MTYFKVHDGRTRESVGEFRFHYEAKAFMADYHMRTGHYAYIVSTYY